MKGHTPQPRIVISPPDDEGLLLAPLLITIPQGAEALGVTEKELQRLVDRRLVDLVHLGPRKADTLVKTESLLRSFGVRVLFMHPEKPRLPPTRDQEGPGQSVAVSPLATGEAG